MSTNPTHLRSVHLAADVYMNCLQHALTSEKEEIMGMLIGEVDDNGISNISASVILPRSDKHPDRVEISPEQLCEASTYAEELVKRLKRPMRVLGWYHSHPHITVWPSDVDLRTQAMYQMMDPLFVGLIFSVYSSDAKSTINKLEVTCFQANTGSGEPSRREIPLIIKPSGLNEYNSEAIAQLPHILTTEIIEQFNEVNDQRDTLTMLHNMSLKTLKITHIISNVSLPMLEFLKNREKSVEDRIKELTLLKTRLSKEIKELS